VSFLTATQTSSGFRNCDAGGTTTGGNVYITTSYITNLIAPLQDTFNTTSRVHYVVLVVWRIPSMSPPIFIIFIGWTTNTTYEMGLNRVAFSSAASG